MNLTEEQIKAIEKITDTEIDIERFEEYEDHLFHKVGGGYIFFWPEKENDWTIEFCETIYKASEYQAIIDVLKDK